MTIIDIINKKRLNQTLTDEEIQFFVEEYTKFAKLDDKDSNKKIKDYQATSLLMSIVINGLNSEETFSLTKYMLHSGKIMDWSSVEGIKVDKHSTGGIGDKVSLILVPIIASLGLKVAKMSGRGLGFTGGTIDKLDSIRFNSNLEGDTNLDLLEKEGCFIMAQTDDLAPADGVIYSLRNSSGTVESLPLIASSVVSKKLALNTDYVFLDVKCGNGAFMKNSEEAIALSELMLDIFTKFNKKAACHITNMSQPLGRAIGNGIEIKAVIDFLNNKPESNEITELIEEFASDMILCTNIANTKDEAIGKVREVISNGTAYKKFISWMTAQNADMESINSGSFFSPKNEYKILATKNGFVSYNSTEEIGMVSLLLGAGRLSKTDPLDFSAGIWLNKIHNESVIVGDVIATLYSSNEITQDIIDRFNNNLLIEEIQFPFLPTIIKAVNNIEIVLKNTF